MSRLNLSLLCLSLFACGSSEQPDPCLAHGTGELVLTEFMLDPDGSDTGAEWVELFNPTTHSVDVGGLTLSFRDLDGSNQKSHVLRPGVVPSHAAFVLGDVRTGPNPSWVHQSYADALGALGNARGAIELRCGGKVIDQVTYSRVARSGRSRMLSGTVTEFMAALNDDESSWCEAPADLMYLPPNAGTPGRVNPACAPEVRVGSCLDDGVVREVLTPRPGEVVITELMTNPMQASDATGEWFELFAREDVDLNGVTLLNGANGMETLTPPDCLHVAKGSYALLARSADPFVNGGLPPPLATYRLSLSGLNERLRLVLGDAGLAEARVLSSASGRAWQRDPRWLGSDLVDEAQFCPAPSRWHADGGGDFGSPGRSNPECPVEDAGTRPSNDLCFDLERGTMREVRHPKHGDLAFSEWLADPAAVADSLGEYVEVFANSDCDFNGLQLVGSAGHTAVQQANCLPADAGSFVLLARSADGRVNGHLPPVTATFSFDLKNSGDTLQLVGADGGVLDAIAWASSKPGQSTQVAPGLLDPESNDGPGATCFTPDAGDHHIAPTPDGGGWVDLGTPGRQNAPCP